MLRRWSWWRDSVDHSRVNRIGHGDTDTDCDRHADSCSDPHGRSRQAYAEAGASGQHLRRRCQSVGLQLLRR